ncbi:DUF3857 domain-containing protein [Ideonella sp.]|uniref:DUF3857 domain-containing protein n=1 Tax=Ideonella sp. TaxID=1929293 RepID=UPI0035AF10D9
MKRTIGQSVGRAMRLFGLAAAVLAGGAATAAPGPSVRHHVGPAPAWVDVIPVAAPAAAPDGHQAAEGLRYLLVDQQVRVQGADRQSYRHVAVQPVNEQGLSSAANLDIGFDPSFQRLTLHWVQVRRGPRLIPKLATAQVRILQREQGLESLMFDGRRTAHLVLEDVHVGDVVEYAYSVQGANTVFRGRHFGGFVFQYGVPVDRIRARLLWPHGRAIHWKEDHAPPSVRSARLGDMDLHEWEATGVPARPVESDAPAWFDPYPTVSWSEFADWADVAAWARPMYQPPTEPGPRVQAVAARIAGQHADPDQRLIAALRLVQSDIRYLGIEVGAHSHEPHAPDLVLQRRYGDCKDKTLLLVSLLRRLGLKADAALVHTSQRGAVAQWLPSPAPFNHVLVRAEAGHRVYWLDPTRLPQTGGATTLTQADFGRALWLTEGATGLVTMAGPSAVTHRRELKTVIDASDGVGKPARYTVQTTTRGMAADSMRQAFGHQSRDTLEKQYLNYYAGRFGDVRPVAPYVVADDPAANELWVTERYEIGRFWQTAQANGQREAEVFVPELLDYLRQPSQVVRKSPLAIAHPVDLSSVTEVKLPMAWRLQTGRVKVVDPAFRFERDTQWDAATRTVTFTDHYVTLADHVPAERMAQYAENLAKARHESSFTLYHTPGAASTAGGMHALPAVVLTLAVLAVGALAWRLYRWDPVPAGGPPSAGPPEGIGGWLLLPALGLPASVLIHGKNFAESLAAYSPATWASLTTPDHPAYHPAYQPILLAELGVHSIAIIGAVLVTVLFYQRRSSLPRLYSAYAATVIVLSLLDMAAAQVLPATGGDAESTKAGSTALRDVLLTAVWIAYMQRSTRVARTFVRRRHAAGPGASDVTDAVAAPPGPTTDIREAAQAPAAPPAATAHG